MEFREGKSCRDEGGLLILPPLFTQKTSERRDLELNSLKRIWIVIPFYYVIRVDL